MKPANTHLGVDLNKQQCVFENLLIREYGVFIYVNEQLPPLPTQRMLQLFMDARNLRLEFRQGPTPGSFLLPRPPVGFAFSTCRPKGYPNGANTPGHDFDYIWNTFESYLAMGALETQYTVVLHPVQFDKDLPPEQCYRDQSKFWGTLGGDSLIGSDEFFHGIQFRTLYSKIFIPARKATEIPAFVPPPNPYLLKAFTLHALRGEIRGHGEVSCRIGIRVKDSRHRFLNTEEMVQFLTARYPHCKVQILSRAVDLTMSEEIQWISNLTVYITPPGGGSYSALFLGRGAMLLVGKICWPINTHKQSNSYGLEYLELNESKQIGVACFKSDGQIWNLSPIQDVHYLTAQRTLDLKFDGDRYYLESEQPDWHSTLNAFQYSYNVSLSQLKAILDPRLLPSSKTTLYVNVAGMRYAKLHPVVKYLNQVEYGIEKSTTMLGRTGEILDESFYLLKSLPRLDLWKPCPASRKSEDTKGLLPSVRWIQCLPLHNPRPCSDRIRFNLLDDWEKFWSDDTKPIRIQHSPVQTIWQMDACLEPIQHFYVISLNNQSSSKEYDDIERMDRVYLMEEYRIQNPLTYRLIYFIQTIRVLLQTEFSLSPRSMDRVFFIKDKEEWMTDPPAEMEKCFQTATPVLDLFKRIDKPVPAFQFKNQKDRLHRMEWKLKEICP